MSLLHPFRCLFQIDDDLAEVWESFLDDGPDLGVEDQPSEALAASA